MFSYQPQKTHKAHPRQETLKRAESIKPWLRHDTDTGITTQGIKTGMVNTSRVIWGNADNIQEPIDYVDWKKMQHLKVENYILFGGFSEDFGPEDSCSDSTEGLRQRAKGGARVHRGFATKTRYSAVAQWVNDLTCLCGSAGLVPSPAQWVKDPALLQLWHRSQLQLELDPWPGNFPMPWGQPKKKKRHGLNIARLLLTKTRHLRLINVFLF